MDATGARREYGIDAIRRGGASAPAGKSAVDVTQIMSAVFDGI